MLFSVLKNRFQNTVLQNNCWQQHTDFKQAILQSFDDVNMLPLNDQEKAQVLRAHLAKLFQGTQQTDEEQAQASSIYALLFNRFPETARQSLTNDLHTLIQTPIPA
jgi:hypothetical protein